MIARNDVTGDELKTGVNKDSYRDGWERIFGRNQAKKRYIRLAREFLAQSCIDFTDDKITEHTIRVDDRESTLIQIYLELAPESAADLVDRFVSVIVEKNYDFEGVSLTFVGTVLPE